MLYTEGKRTSRALGDTQTHTSSKSYVRDVGNGGDTWATGLKSLDERAWVE